MTSRRRFSREEPSKNFVGFVIGDVRYALPIAAVLEIVNPLGLIELPGAPTASMGVAQYRDEVLPVVSLRARLGLPAEFATRQTKWIIIEFENRRAAVIVDAVTEVFHSSGTTKTAALGAHEEQRGIIGVAQKSGALVFVLDVAAITTLAAPTNNDTLALAEANGEK